MGGRLSRGRQRGLEQAVPLASPHTGLSWRDRRGGSPAGWGLVFTVATKPVRTQPNSQHKPLQGQGLPHLCHQTETTWCFCPSLSGPHIKLHPPPWQDQPEWALKRFWSSQVAAGPSHQVCRVGLSFPVKRDQDTRRQRLSSLTVGSVAVMAGPLPPLSPPQRQVLFLWLCNMRLPGLPAP